MKKTLLACLLCALVTQVQAQTQYLGTPGGKVVARGKFEIDSLGYLPRVPVSSRTPDSAAFLFDPNLENFYIADGAYYNNVSAGRTYYVSAGGISVGTGATPATAITFDRLQALSAGFSGGERIYFKAGGTYYDTLTVRSGSYIGRYGSGPNPLLNGTQLSTGRAWVQNGTVWSAFFPQRVTRLFLNGIPQNIAQSPYYTITSRTGLTLITATGAAGLGPWVTKAEMVGKEFAFRWFYNTIVAYNSGAGAFTTDPNGNNASAGEQFKLQNEINLLAPGTWCWENDSVYYESPGNVNPATLNVAFAVQNQSIYAPNNSSNITIAGLDFFGQGQDGIYMDSASDITIRDCHFKNQYNSAITMMGTVSRLNIINCQIDSTADNGIETDACYNLTMQGDTVTNIATQHDPPVIRDNSPLPVPGSRYLWPTNKQQGIGFACYPNSAFNTVYRNVIYNTAYVPIEMDASYSIVEQNKLHNYNIRQVDGGGVYTYGDSAQLFATVGWHNVYGLQVLNNLIYSPIDSNEAGNPVKGSNKSPGVYLDNGARTSFVAGNSVINCSAGVFLDNNVQNVTIQGNLLYNGVNGGIYFNQLFNDDSLLIQGTIATNNMICQADTGEAAPINVQGASVSPFLVGGQCSYNTFVSPYLVNAPFDPYVLFFAAANRNLAAAQSFLSQPMGQIDQATETFVDSTTGARHFLVQTNSTYVSQGSLLPSNYRSPVFSQLHDNPLGPYQSALFITDSIPLPGIATYVPYWNSFNQLVPSYRRQTGVGSTSTFFDSAFIYSRGVNAGYTMDSHDGTLSPFSWYSLSGEFTIHNTALGDRMVLPKNGSVIGAIFYPASNSSASFPLATVADNGGRGPVFLDNTGSQTNIAVNGLQFGINTNYSAINSYSNVSLGTPHPFAVQTGGSTFAIGSTTFHNHAFEVTGTSSFSDTGALAARFTYNTDIAASFTKFSLVDKNYVDSSIGLKASANLTAQTTAVTVTSYAVPGTGGFNSFRVGGYITVTAVATDVIQLQVAWTDETGTSRTQNFFVQGATNGISTTGANGYSPMDIRVQQGTTITMQTVLTTGIGSITYDVGSTITQLL